MKIEPKHDLLVFSKKEVGIILILLALVALFSFTLGLKIGKKLGASSTQEQTNVLEHKPLTGEDDTQVHHEESAHEEVKHEEAKDGHPVETTQEKSEEKENFKKESEELANETLKKELVGQEVGAGKQLPMAYPSEKRATTKVEKMAVGKYTLQVGSHRTTQEAMEQVAELKKVGLDAFYLEVKVPNRGTWYRVGVGVFATKDMAEKSAQKWKSSHILPSYIIQKVGE